MPEDSAIPSRLGRKRKSTIAVTSKPQYDRWNSLLDSLPHGNLDQTHEYGESMKRAHPGSELVRLLAFEKEPAVGVLQGLYQRKRGYGRNLKVGGSYGSAPVASFEDGKEEIIVSLLQALNGFAVRNRIVEGEIHWPQEWGFSSIFEDLKYEATSSYNVYVVPLNGPSSDLWSKMHPNKRRNVKKAELAGVRVECGRTAQDFQSFLGMLKAAALRANFDPRISEIEELWKEFSPKGSARIFLSKWKDRDVASTFIITHGDTAYARAAGSVEDAWEVRPNDIVHWKAMEWACEQGYSWYSMGGVEYPEPHEGCPGWGLWRWKREWRGILERILVYSKVYLPTLRKLMDASRIGRRIAG